MSSHSKAPTTTGPIPPRRARKQKEQRHIKNMESTIQLSSELKRLRDSRGVTLRDLSEQTGVSNSYLSQLENHQIKEPSLHVVAKIAQFYGISYQRFLKVFGYVDSESKDSSSERHIDGLKDLSSDDIEYVRDFVDFLRFKQTRLQK